MVKASVNGEEKSQGSRTRTTCPAKKTSDDPEQCLEAGEDRDATVNQCACWGGCVEWSGQSESAVLEGFSELAGGIWTGEMTFQNSSLTHLHNLFKVSNSLSKDRMLSWPRYAPSGRMWPAKGSSPPS